MSKYKLCIAFFLLIVIQSQVPKLLMINELFRHGARYPVYPKIEDNSANYTYAQHSYGELTTNGKKMHYLLGQFLYQQYYSQLFKHTAYQTRYNQSKFYIKSTDVNRTIQSVQSQMMGLLEKLDPLIIVENQTEFSKPQWYNNNKDIQVKAGPVFPFGERYHPIAIHVEKGGSDPFNSGDFLRTYSPDNCPNQNLWIDQNHQNPRFSYIINNDNFTRAITALSIQINRNISFIESAAYYDNYQCARYMGRSYLKVFQNPQHLRALGTINLIIHIDYIHTIQMYMSLYSNQKQIRATATGFFNQSVRNIKKVIANKQEVQWNIYSAHDTTVGNMLAALNLTNVECIYEAFLSGRTNNSDTCVSQYPKYTSNLIFEVWEYNTSYHTIRVRYNGQIRQIPFCGWKTECSVETFYAWYEQFKDEDYLQTCGVILDEVEIYFSIAAAEFMVILVLALAGVVHCLKNKKNSGKLQNNGFSGEVSSNSMITDSLINEQERSE